MSLSDSEDDPPLAPPPRQSLLGIRVLVLDDNAAYAGALARIIENSGGVCFPAFSAPEAMRILAKHEPDAAVVDLLLFDGNGFEFIATVREVMPSLACVLHTAMPLPEGYEPTVVYLPKPCDADEIVSAILDAIGRMDTTPPPTERG